MDRPLLEAIHHALWKIRIWSAFDAEKSVQSKKPVAASLELYLPIKKCAESLDEINATMGRIAAAIEAGIRGANSQRIQEGGGRATCLLALQSGAPDFAAIERPQAADLPSVKWKLLNLNKLKHANPEKHAAQRDALAKLLGWVMPLPAREGHSSLQSMALNISPASGWSPAKA